MKTSARNNHKENKSFSQFKKFLVHMETAIDGTEEEERKIPYLFSLSSLTAAWL